MAQARNLSLFADNVSSSGTVAVAGITATGTPSSSTYLRGDGSWTTRCTDGMKKQLTGLILLYEIGKTQLKYKRSITY